MSTSLKNNRKAKRAKPDLEYKLFGHDDRPRGDDVHRQSAKAFLIPFPPRKLKGRKGDVCERLVEQEIYDLACVYNSHRLAAAVAPRSNVPRQKFVAIARAADELRNLLSSLGDLERGLYEGSEQSSELYSRARGDWLPRSSVIPRLDSESKWLDQLHALSELSRSVLAFFNSKIGPDVGGRTNVHKDFFHSPEYVLIQYGWELFERYQPGKATTSETGIFHLFLQQVYEYATGNGSNERGAPALVPKIKQMLKPLREWAIYIESWRRAEDLKAKIRSRLKRGATLTELKGPIEELMHIFSKIDFNAGPALMTATTRKRARHQTS